MPKTIRIPQQQSVAGILPPSGDWMIQTARSMVAITGRASRLSPTVRVEIGGVEGGLHLATDPSDSRVEVCLDVRTMTTGNPLWDEMLRAANPLSAAQHPMAHYVSNAVSWTGAGFHVEGELQLAGIRTALTLEAAVTENADTSVSLCAEGVIDPRTVGIHLDLPGARLFMPRQMTLSISVAAARLTAGSNRAASTGRFVLAS